MSKFGVGDVICPRSGIVPTQDLKVHFDFLVYPFGFSVQLRVIGSGKDRLYFRSFASSWVKEDVTWGPWSDMILL